MTVYMCWLPEIPAMVLGDLLQVSRACGVTGSCCNFVVRALVPVGLWLLYDLCSSLPRRELMWRPK